MDIVEAQLRAYNAHDLEGFLAWYTEDVVIEDGGGHVLMEGREGMRSQYGPFFVENPALRGEIVDRMQIGAYVVDEELIHGAGEDLIRAIAIYRIAGDAIAHVRFLQE